MFTHIGMLTLADDATPEHRQAISDGLTGLAGLIDGLVAVRVGIDLGLTEGNADVLFQLEFDSEDAWRSYGAHPAHKAVIAESIAPVLKSKSFVQVAGFAEARA
ncbi:Dabb family protein [Microbacterium sp. NPDC055910]|uniref:Dabb family protein n=1 Tax=Microbacterium sp. NPDC055910 TaxID=3345659 RepID=UPI0035DB224E